MTDRGITMITGQCECRKVRFEIHGEINDYSHCHCSQCRRMHGAAFATFGGVLKRDFKFTSGTDEITHYASSDDHNRLFCRICGSNILVDLSAEPDALYVAMGVIDGDPKLPEGYHIFVGSKAPWYAFDNPGEQFHTVPEE